MRVQICGPPLDLRPPHPLASFYPNRSPWLMDLEESFGNRCGYAVNAIKWLYITLSAAPIWAHRHGSCGLPCLIMPLRKESLKAIEDPCSVAFGHAAQCC